MKVRLYQIVQAKDQDAVIVIDHANCRVTVCQAMPTVDRYAALFRAGYETALEHHGLRPTGPCRAEPPDLDGDALPPRV
jgi:tRNA isopentenyl-2-thiomethyl-A-37 hydroxylase MiaE